MDRYYEPLQAYVCGLPLRRYLMNGISFHLRELLRERVRRKTLPIVDESILVSKSLRADELFERAWALSILSDACTASRDAKNERTKSSGSPSTRNGSPQMYACSGS